MKCYVGIDLGSTTTKAIVLDEDGEILGRGITNSRSNYDVACEVARNEAFVDARMQLFRRDMGARPELASYTADFLGASLGALLASAWLIPVLGVTKMCWLAAALNLLGAVAVLLTRPKPA